MAKPKIFVSHSTKDTAFATRLVNNLNAAGAQAWLDVNDLGAGDFQERISQALADCEWFLLVLTRNALASDWVRMEVDAAIHLKHQKRIKELIFIKAADVDHSELPALWSVFNIFDATVDYMASLKQTLKVIGMSTGPQQPALVDGILSFGVVSLVSGDYMSALRAFQKVLTIDPTSNDALTRIISVLRGFIKANEANEERIKQTPNETEMILQIMQELPHKDRLALQLRYFDQIPTAEIAETLGVSPTTVRKMISRALYHLNIQLRSLEIGKSDE